MPKRPAPPPVEAPKEMPSRSRRQASKEALKQMQLLLDDENEAVEIASDEDVSALNFVNCLKYLYLVINYTKISISKEKSITKIYCPISFYSLFIY